MATHSSILAWKFPWIPPAEEPGGLLSMGSQELNMTKQQQMKKLMSLTRTKGYLLCFHE